MVAAIDDDDADVVDDGHRSGDVNGSVVRVNTSPDTRMGSRSPNFDVRNSRASTSMGSREGVRRVRGWMVRKSTGRFCAGWPRTVSMKSTVFLRAVHTPCCVD